jgi:uncharacterized protein DUF7010
MKTLSEIDAIRQHAILASLAGFPFLLVFGIVWITAGVLSYLVPREVAPWIYLMLGMPATPVAMAIERRSGYLPSADPDPLVPLVLQVFFVQIVAFPAILLVWDQTPEYVPVAFAAVVGAHFLPFDWIYQTTLYRILGIVVSVAPFVVLIFVRERALHYTGFVVGAALLAGAFVARAHARATWLERSRVPPGAAGA